MLAIEGAALEDALNRLRHIQPRPAQRRIERHNAVREEPEDEAGCRVAGQVIQDQQESERREVLGERDPDGQPFLPALPAAAVLVRWRRGWRGQAVQDRG